MSHATFTLQLSSLNTYQRIPTVAQWAMTFAVTVTHWDNRYRTRKQLAELPAERLTDIGLDANAARIEAAKPFWRA